MLKHTYTFFVLIGIAALLSACKGDSLSAGNEQFKQDDIIVQSDSTRIGASLFACASVVSSPDSLLLGEMQTVYGTIQADILTQVACPAGFVYPDNAELDSVGLYLYYTSWTGDGQTPLEIDVRELDTDREPLSYSQLYQTNLSISQFCDITSDANRILENKRIVSVSRGDTLSGSSSGLHFIYLKVDRAWAQDFFDRQKADHSRNMATIEDFNKVFHGLFITTTFGGGAVLNVSDISLSVFYHYTYEKTVIDPDGEHYTKVLDTIRNYKAFYATQEIKQVNRIRHFGTDGQPSNYTKTLANDSICYIMSPAGVYTRLSIPVRALAERIFTQLYDKEQGIYRRPYVNLAKMRVDILNYYEGLPGSATNRDWAQPAKNMLLIKDYALQSFFSERELPSDTLALLSSIVQSKDSTGEYRYHYNYDLGLILTQQLRMAYDKEAIDYSQIPDTLNMIMVPVNVSTASSGSYGTTTIGVTEEQTISNTIIASDGNKKQPLSLEVVYSGF